LDGEKITQQTLLWDPDKSRTAPMRGKADAHDYRYFPDPDLVPVEIDDKWIEQVQAALPELAEQRQLRFVDKFALSEYDAAILTGSRELADYFEETLSCYSNAKKLSNFIGTELLREFSPEDMGKCPVKPRQLAKLLSMVEKGDISGKIAKTVFTDMLATCKDPETIVREQGLVQMSDSGELTALVREIIVANPAQAEQFREGKNKVIGFFVGQLMQKTQGKANPQMANKLFEEELKSLKPK
jgi:aspartyl-tRNA(Asn)/glutamyl-tRNA(Gln) amidotransferase subunit B